MEPELAPGENIEHEITSDSGGVFYFTNRRIIRFVRYSNKNYEFLDLWYKYIVSIKYKKDMPYHRLLNFLPIIIVAMIYLWVTSIPGDYKIIGEILLISLVIIIIYLARIKIFIFGVIAPGIDPKDWEIKTSSEQVLKIVHIIRVNCFGNA